MLHTYSKGRTLYTMNYNARGVRTSKIKETPSLNGINLETTNYTYDSEGRLRRETRNAFERIYLYSSDGIIGYEEDGEKFLYRKNLFGDITAIYQGTTKVAEYVYDAWGNCTITYDPDGYGASNPIRYRGYYWDSDIKMYYLMTRYYDPKIGRFINADTPNYLNPNTVNGLNLYAYCGNNPIMCIDPSGHEPLSIIMLMTLEYLVPVLLLSLVGIAAILIAYNTKKTETTQSNGSKTENNELENNQNTENTENTTLITPPVIGPSFTKSTHSFGPIAVTVDDVANYGSTIGGYVGSINIRLGGRTNDYSTYTSKYGGKYDSFNSGNWVGYGGLGSWGKIMERFLDEYEIPNFD